MPHHSGCTMIKAGITGLHYTRLVLLQGMTYGRNARDCYIRLLLAGVHFRWVWYFAQIYGFSPVGVSELLKRIKNFVKFNVLCKNFQEFCLQ